METLTDLSQETRDEVIELIHAQMDAVHALESGLEQSESFGLSSHLAKIAGEHRLFAQQLQALLGIEGHQPPRTGTVRGELKIIWTEFKNALMGSDPLRVLDQVIASEGLLEQAYRGALISTSGSPLNATLLDQLRRIHEHALGLSAIRDEMASAKT